MRIRIQRKNRMRINAAVAPKHCVLHFCTRIYYNRPLADAGDRNNLRRIRIWLRILMPIEILNRIFIFFPSLKVDTYSRHRTPYCVQVQVQPNFFCTFWTYERWQYFKNSWFKAVRPGSGSGSDPGSKRIPPTSVADPDPRSGAYLTPGSGMSKLQNIRIRIRDEQPGSYFRELRIRNNFLS